MVRAGLLGALCLALLVVDAAAQEPSKATYFLIDVSGSMKGKDAEAKVSELLEPIKAANPEALVSRTYFRAIDGDACWAPVKIADLVPAAQSAPIPFASEDDFTPLGEALRAAILYSVAKGGAADIFIVSDGQPTASCGVDICIVAEALLPISGINVELIPADSDTLPQLDKLGCIDAAEAKRSSRTVDPLPPKPQQKDLALLAMQFFETWTWLLGFLLIAIAAWWFGWKYSSKALSVENDTNEARSLRNRIEAGDDQAKGLLKELADKNRQTPRTALPRALGLLGITVFGLLMFVSDTAGLWGYNFKSAKQSAWDVLDTNFATAFAATWITLLYFAATQHQRLREAEHNFRIATDEARRTADLKITAAQKHAFENYEETYDKVVSVRFEVGRSESSENPALERAFGSVATTAIALAVQTKLPKDELQAALEKETQRLREFIPRFRRLSLSAFIDVLAKQDLLPKDGKSNDWTARPLTNEAIVRLANSLETAAQT